MRIHPVRALAAAVTAAVAGAVALGAAPALAGGPTSAFLAVPGAGQTASLYYTDPAYDELSNLVGVGEPSGTFAGEESSSGHESGRGVTITWLIHDVEPWRVDRVYLGGEGEVWISTQIGMGASIWESPTVWHQPENGKRLANLLGELGLGTRPPADTSADEAAAAAPADSSPPASAPAPETVRDVTADPGTDTLATAGWATGGLAAGVLLTVAWTRTRRRGAAQTDPDVSSSEPPWALPNGPVEHLSAR